VVACLTAGFTLLAASLPAAAPPRPNVVLIFCDDLGYADLGCYGGGQMQTPHLDRLARDGVRFTDFYAAQAVCSASRAALLTGCYPNRIGILGALGPRARTGIHANEVTLAELLKTQRYATAMFGKWHLGDAPQFLPTRHGFDEYYGLPYSNDMWPHHPTSTNYPPLPLLEGERVVQLMPDQTQLTTAYTERAVKFIERQRGAPFFLYMAHSMPHVPLHVSDKFKGKSTQGLYADVILEIDGSVGQILDALRRHELERQTLVIFTSDNGPWLLYGNHAGSALPLREGKATTFDGGVRVPCLMRWPGQIPAGRVCHALSLTMDILPTVAALAGAELPKDRVIDGKNIWPLMTGQPGAQTPHEAFFYYWGQHLQAVRSGPWKLHFPHGFPKPTPPGGDGKPGQYANLKTGLELYNLEHDIGEAVNVAAQHPRVVQRLQTLANAAREDLGDSATQRKGRNLREPGRVDRAD
jgi:arylsulfatase A-like enzyme